VISGTAALHLALLELGAAAGDLVLVPTLTFAATANAVMYTGATPVFIDADPLSWQVDAELVAQTVERLLEQGRRPAAVVTVDLYGGMPDYERLVAVCDEFGVPLLEDAAEGLGSAYRGRAAGSFGAAAALSFNGNKIVTTGGGGALLTSDAKLAAHASKMAQQAREPVAHYEHEEIGYNYRLSNLSAAVGVAQVARLDGMIARRREHRAAYARLFSGCRGVSMLGDHEAVDSNAWLSVALLDPKECPVGPEELIHGLAVQGIEARRAWKPMHLQPIFREAAVVSGAAAERAFATGVCLPSGSAMTDEQRARVLETLEGLLG
jgi:dTDP-4-amino-4,6-dideoxygalactose transaminase